MEDRVAACVRKLEGAGNVSASALVEVLRETEAVLDEMDQESRTEKVRALASQLVGETLCGHKAGSVRLWVASCQCEILRLFAPMAPYTSAEVVRVFALISAQLRRVANARALDGGLLSDQALVERVGRIVESLRRYQSCLALVELYRRGDDETEVALVDLVDAAVSAARDEVPAIVREAIVDVVCLVVSECDPLPAGLLEVLLVTLLPSSRKECPAVHAAAQQVFGRLHETLTRPVAAFLNACLSVSTTEEEQRGGFVVTTSEAAPHVYALVYEIHVVEPRMLLYTMPKAADRLRADDPTTRDATATLLARLFAAHTFDYPTAYPGVYGEWLRRFVDKDPDIRAKMVRLGLKCCAATLEHFEGPLPVHRHAILDACAARLSDPQWEVRRAAVHACADAVFALDVDKNDDSAWDVVVEGLAHRVTDKRADIRKEALTGLTSIYRKHVAAPWEADPSEDAVVDAVLSLGRRRRPETPSRLSFVPALALRSYAAACNAGEVKDRARLVLDERLFLSPKKKSFLPKPRAAVVLAVVVPATIENDAAKAGFELLLRDQARHQREVEAYLEAYAEHAAAKKPPRVSHDDDSADDDDAELNNPALSDAHSRLEAAHARLAALVPPPDGRTTLPRQLSAAKDRHVFRLLKLVADPKASRRDRDAARDELVARLDGPKSNLAPYVAKLARRCADALVDADIVAAALDFATDALDREEEEEETPLAASCATLVKAVAKQHPKLLATGVEALGRYARAAMSARETDSFVAASRAVASLARVLNDDIEVDVESKKTLAAAADESLVSVATAGLDDDKDENGLDDDEFYGDCSKEAVAALHALHGDPKDDDEEETLAARLFEAVDREPWTASSRRIVARLKTLNRLVLLFPEAFSRISGADDVIDAVRNDLVYARVDPPKKKRKKTERFSVTFLALRAAIKVLAYRAMPLDAADTPTLDVLFGIIEDDGRPPSGAAASPVERAELRLSAASSALKLATRNPAVARDLEVARWRALARVALDPDADVRAHFSRKLACVVEHRADEPTIFAKWGSVLCLAACTDDKPLKARATKALKIAVGRARAAHARAVDADQPARDLLPEYALPYALHLLAHVKEEEHLDPARALALLFDALVGSLGDDADNVAFLLRCCAEVAAGQDAASPDRTDACRAIASLAADAIKRNYVKTVTNFSPYPGVVYLPAKLFAAAADVDATRRFNNILAPVPIDARSNKSSRRAAPTSARKSAAAKMNKKKKMRTAKPAARDDFSEDDEEDDDSSKENAAPRTPPRQKRRHPPKPQF